MSDPRFHVRGPSSRIALPLAGVLMLAVGMTAGAEDQENPSEIEDLQKELQVLRAEYERRIAELEARLASRQESATTDKDALARQLAEEPGAGEPEEQPAAAPAPRPITLISGNDGKNYLNLSLDGLIVVGTSSEPDIPRLELGSHDPRRRGFTLQNAEIVLSGAVDPYFTAQGNIVFVESAEGETEIELEELYATTSSLPARLQLRVGHFLTEFGRLNAQHPHSWDFVDVPIGNVRMFGADGLRATGSRLSWLMPTSFYSELLLTVQNAFGETLTSFGWLPGEAAFGRTLVEVPVRSLEDLLYVPRWAGSFDLTENQTIVVGASSAFGPNGTGTEGRSRLLGVDLFWKWKSPRANQGFPFVTLQMEGLDRRYRADAPAATFEDEGAYAQVVWGFRRGWSVGARYGETEGDDGGDPSDPFFEDRSRASAAVTWYPSEYSRLRLQYSRDNRSFYENANSLWVQFEFILGAHAAHKF